MASDEDAYGDICASITSHLTKKQMASPKEFILRKLEETFSVGLTPTDTLAPRPASGSNDGSRGEWPP